MNDWMLHLPLIISAAFAFAFGLVVGSFLNVLIARLPFEKSVVWPGSRCFTCLQPIRSLDNLPIIGYLRLRGKCRQCGAKFSARYLWVELFTGFAFLGLFLAEIAYNLHGIPAIRDAMRGGDLIITAWLYFFAHAFLLAMLIAASVVDLKYKIIPPMITVGGTLVGLAFSTLLPWPWPNDPRFLWGGLQVLPWFDFRLMGAIPHGIAMWPCWGPPPAWAPAGSWQLGLLTGVVGAAVGQAIGRLVKFLFETGFGKEALGIGDADLMMMAGAFLGWQPVAIAFFVGAVVLLPIVLLQRVYESIRGLEPSLDRSIPFGPGIAAGIVICWLGWSFFGELVRTVFFEPYILAVMVVILGGGLLAMGTLITLVRGGGEEEPK